MESPEHRHTIKYDLQSKVERAARQHTLPTEATQQGEAGNGFHRSQQPNKSARRNAREDARLGTHSPTLISGIKALQTEGENVRSANCTACLICSDRQLHANDVQTTGTLI